MACPDVAGTSNDPLAGDPGLVTIRAVDLAGEIFADPLRAYTVLAAAALVVLSAAAWLARLSAAWVPIRTWLLILPAIFIPLWLGAAAWAIFVTVVAILGAKEFAKTTGLYSQRPFVLVVYAAIVAVNAAAFARHDGIFITLPMWSFLALTLVPIVMNRTEAMVQWFALSVMAITFYGFFLGHLVWLYGSPQGLGYLLYVLTATQLNDVLAFLGGKRFGRHRWTALSPNKTIEGSLFALAATVALAFVQAPIAFPHLPWYGVLLAGLIVGVGGQVGDLTMALIKRNAGVKDFGGMLPGHGGVTDRTNSLMITAPTFTHAIGFLFGPT
jgi:phosphatidate cytidylyltransferase